ncbi:MAG: hypothetical protein ACT4QE_10550 [Anaerolineales bacterium]
MKLLKLQHWLRQIYQTEEEEISCSECLDLVSDYVDLEIAGEAAREKLPLLKQHLDQCGVCLEEYEVLRDLARLEAEGRAPALDEPRKSL